MTDSSLFVLPLSLSSNPAIVPASRPNSDVPAALLALSLRFYFMEVNLANFLVQDSLVAMVIEVATEPPIVQVPVTVLPKLLVQLLVRMATPLLLPIAR